MISVTSADRRADRLGFGPENLEPPTHHSSIRSQVIVTEFQGQRLAFPSSWVEEVMLFPRQKVLRLPFYRAPVLGLVPHQGDLVLLLEYQSDQPMDLKPMGQQEHIRAIRLGAPAEHLAGAAILIEKIIGTIHESEVSAQPSLQGFSPDCFARDAFDPYRWG